MKKAVLLSIVIIIVLIAFYSLNQQDHEINEAKQENKTIFVPQSEENINSNEKDSETKMPSVIESGGSGEDNPSDTGQSTDHVIITTVPTEQKIPAVNNSQAAAAPVSSAALTPAEQKEQETMQTTEQETKSADFTALQLETLEYINAAREKNNLNPLVLDGKLCEGATLKSNDMVLNNYFGHTSPVYGTPFEMMDGLDIPYRAAAENIAKNTSGQGAFNAFMNSERHRANILNPKYSKVGLGFCQKEQYLYVTQWFTD